MLHTAPTTIKFLVFPLVFVSVVTARGAKHDGTSPNEGGTAASPEPGGLEPTLAAGVPSYFNYGSHRSYLYAHISLALVSWTVLLPLAVAASISRARRSQSIRILFVVTNGLGLLMGVVYNHKTPDLYEHDSHGKLSWFISIIAFLWPILETLYVYSSRQSPALDNPHATPLLTQARLAKFESSRPLNPTRWSNDSGHGTERNSASLHEVSRCSTTDLDCVDWSESRVPLFLSNIDGRNEVCEQHDWHESESRCDRGGGKWAAFSSHSHSILRISSVLIERSLLILGFTDILVGVVVLGGIARGNHIFNILAHFIKGGIFFWYGLLTLGRWMGCFGDFGWAWNVRPGPELVGYTKYKVPSAEFTESFVIFLYGASNLFLEHLAAWGGEWTPQDLEHVSISIMFFGGGTLGMLVESRRVRSMLNQTIQLPNEAANEELRTSPVSYNIPMNPIPGLIILLLGIMMSSHHQSSMLSTMIHKQWGTMFIGFALARAVTYIITYLSPPTSYLPNRPPSEIIASFCLISGGLLFMESNKDTIASLESFGLDAMFTFTVTMGFTCLVMAWATIVLAAKGWMSSTNHRTNRLDSIVNAR